jgi:hypothetical protein
MGQNSNAHAGHITVLRINAIQFRHHRRENLDSRMVTTPLWASKGDIEKVGNCAMAYKL